MKRPWKERLARNYLEINSGLLLRYYEEEQINTALFSTGELTKNFLDWVGLSSTPSAVAHVKRLITKLG